MALEESLLRCGAMPEVSRLGSERGDRVKEMLRKKVPEAATRTSNALPVL
jgi:hypothetical protein